jgi:hypothetical protein
MCNRTATTIGRPPHTRKSTASSCSTKKGLAYCNDTVFQDTAQQGHQTRTQLRTARDSLGGRNTQEQE